MAVTTAAAAPYAPPSAILEIINRHRSRGLPTPINSEVLGRAGISDSLIPRTLQALQTLELIDEQGAPTPALEGMRLAPEGEFKKRMAEWLNRVYADVLNFIDPATASENDIRDAFRTYNPIGQQPRMVTLFSGLYAEAGIGPEKDAHQRTPRKSAPRPRTVKGVGTARGEASALGISSGPNAVPPAIAGLLSSLPPQGNGWTQEARDKFLKTFGAVLDFCFPIVEAEEMESEAEDQEQ